MKAMKITGHILAALTVAFILAIGIGESITELRETGLSGIDPEIWYVIVPVIVIVAGYVLAWWRSFAGGVTLIAGYLVFSFSPTVLALASGDGFEVYLVIWLYLLPLLVAGVLFVLSSVYSSRLTV